MSKDDSTTTTTFSFGLIACSDTGDQKPDLMSSFSESCIAMLVCKMKGRVDPQAVDKFTRAICYSTAIKF